MMCRIVCALEMVHDSVHMGLGNGNWKVFMMTWQKKDLDLRHIRWISSNGSSNRIGSFISVNCCKVSILDNNHVSVECQDASLQWNGTIYSEHNCELGGFYDVFRWPSPRAGKHNMRKKSPVAEPWRIARISSSQVDHQHTNSEARALWPVLIRDNTFTPTQLEVMSASFCGLEFRILGGPKSKSKSNSSTCLCARSWQIV